MRAALAAALLIIAAASAAGAQGLKRLTLRQDLLGLEAVGRIDLGEEGYCTGTLIAPDLVLTAAHCIVLEDGGVDPSVMRFRAGLRDGEAIAERRVARSVADPRYDPRSDGIDRVLHDVALLELSEPIPAGAVAPFSLASLPGDRRSVGVVSFARGRDAAPSRQADCAVIGRQGGLFAFDCDVDFGSSGAPVFDRSGPRPVIVSMISAGRRDADGAVSFGMELVAVVAALKQALRTGRGVSEARQEPAAGPLPQGAKGAGGARFIRP